MVGNIYLHFNHLTKMDSDKTKLQAILNPSSLRIGNLMYNRKGDIIEITLHCISMVILWNQMHYDELPPICPIKLTGDGITRLGFKYMGEVPFVEYTYELDFCDDTGEKATIQLFPNAGGEYTLMLNGNYVRAVEFAHELQNICYEITKENLKLNKK